MATTTQSTPLTANPPSNQTPVATNKKDKKNKTTEKEESKKKAREEKRAHLRQPLLERSKYSPIHTRPQLSENYENPVSGREGWWRKTIRETPHPGAYEVDPFGKDLKEKTNTYRFKSDGRKRDPQPQIGKGKVLLPGAYEHRDMAQSLETNRKTYAFKDTGRDKRDFLNFGKKDKDINVSPDAYETDKYLTLSVDKASSKFWQFKSQSHRFPTIQFKPKDGPSPGNYEYDPPEGLHCISSSFKSKTPRFRTSHTKVPAPGTYETTFQNPIPATILKMGRQHGIFFSSAFQA